MCLYTGSDFNDLRTFIRNYGRKGAKPNKRNTCQIVKYSYVIFISTSQET